MIEIPLERAQAIRAVVAAARQLLEDADREWGAPPQSYQYDRSDLRQALIEFDSTEKRQSAKGDSDV